MIGRGDAEALDAADALAHCRDWFVIPDDGVVYLDGNSLGRTPKRTIAELHRVATEEWAGGLIGSWKQWLDLPGRVGDAVAPLIGAHPGEVIVHDSTSVNLYQLIHAAVALRPGRRVIAVDPTDFPSDVYLAAGIATSLGYELRHGFDRLDDVAVVVRSLVDYRSATTCDLAGETQRIHGAGALALWDLSHAAGAIRVDLHGAGVQLAVGCTYKFLNGGPGAPAFSYVASELQAAIEQPIHGWFGQGDQFEMDATYDPHVDARKLLIGTPAILALTAARVGIETVAEAGIERIAAKGMALTDLALRLCAELELSTSTPHEAEHRGAHIAVHRPDAEAMVAELAVRGVITDLRRPDIIRVGCSALTTRFVDVWDGVTMIAELAEQARGNR